MSTMGSRRVLCQKADKASCFRTPPRGGLGKSGLLRSPSSTGRYIGYGVLVIIVAIARLVLLHGSI